MARIIFAYRPVRTKGRENLPAGAAVLCPNHRAALDPVYLARAVGRRRSIAFLGKSEVMNGRFLTWFFKSLGVVPIRRGANDIGAMKGSLAVLKSGGYLGVFPQGTRVATEEDTDAKAGAALLAARTSAPMVPVYIDGSDKPFGVVRVTFGKPIPVSAMDRRSDSGDGYRLVAQRLMEEIRLLKGKAV